MRALVFALAALVVAPHWRGGDVSTAAVRASHSHEAAPPALAEEIDPRSEQRMANADLHAGLLALKQLRPAVVAVERVPADTGPLHRPGIDVRTRALRGPPIG